MESKEENKNIINEKEDIEKDIKRKKYIIMKKLEII